MTQTKNESTKSLKSAIKGENRIKADISLRKKIEGIKYIYMEVTKVVRPKKVFHLACYTKERRKREGKIKGAKPVVIEPYQNQTEHDVK